MGSQSISADLRLDAVDLAPIPAPGREACTLILIRHAQSVANAERRFTKHDDEPLTDLGEQQALAIGRALAGHTKLGAVIASPFLRTVQTARLAASAFALEPSLEPRLREQSFGQLAGRPYQDYFPEVVGLGPSERWGHAAAGGESLVQVSQRVLPALREIGSRHQGLCVLVVAHGGVLAAVRGALIGDFTMLPLATANARGYVVLARPGLGVWQLEGPVEIFDSQHGKLAADGGILDSVGR